ncbi:MAG: hypothetical protein KGL37_09380, partial [Acidobacteriota bacterium]|nr:hypothetical protein [Acidobacteriota bacterium]
CHRGYRHRLADGGLWDIPLIRRPPAMSQLVPGAPLTGLPQDIGWDDEGKFCETIKPAYRQLWEDSAEICDMIFEADGRLRDREFEITIEQGLMPRKNGKEHEWEIGVATANPLTAMIQDYDWADEVLHARIGKEWLVPEIGSQVAAMEYGDRAWSKILVDWKKWKDDGRTEHRNWWPEVYRAACRHWGTEPDPVLLAYNTTYENARADLKEVAVS